MQFPSAEKESCVVQINPTHVVERLAVGREREACEEGMAQTIWREALANIYSHKIGPSGSDFSAVFDQFLRILGMNALYLG